MRATNPAPSRRGQGRLYSELSEARQALIRLFQATNYGEIRELQISDCEPVLTPSPVVVLDVKLDSGREPRPEVDLADFELAHEVRRLLDQLDEIENGEIERIEIRAGVPRRLVFQQRLSTYKGVR
jgi:hypothetical protein